MKRSGCYGLVLVLGVIGMTVGCRTRLAETDTQEAEPAVREDFSFGYWKNGWRKNSTGFTRK